MINKVWQKNYLKERYNRYPFDSIVSFVLNRFNDVQNKEDVFILALGCGGGNKTEFLYKEGFNTYAIDGSSASINFTKKRLSKYDCEDKCFVSEFKSINYIDNLSCIIY